MFYHNDLVFIKNEFMLFFYIILEKISLFEKIFTHIFEKLKIFFCMRCIQMKQHFILYFQSMIILRHEMDAVNHMTFDQSEPFLQIYNPFKNSSIIQK